MSEARIDIVGVYRLDVTEDLLKEQFKALYGSDITKSEKLKAEAMCKKQLSSTVMVEAIVTGRDAKFDVGNFMQACESEPAENWQVAWAEAYLTLDGKSLMVDRWQDPPAEGDLRIVFFIHFWEPNVPLQTSYGKIACPQVENMPERLKKLVPYEPVD